MKTIDDAKKVVVGSGVSVAQKPNVKDAKKREYSKKELDSLYDNIFEIEI